MTTGTSLILIFLVTLLITLRWLRGSWSKALVSMAFAPAFLAVVAPVAYFLFSLLFSGLNSLLEKAGMALSFAHLGLAAGIFTGMLLLGLTVMFGINELRTREPRSRICVAGSAML